jgi:hypothetical protein
MAGHDVSDEPRVPQGNGRDSGQWTARDSTKILRKSSKSIATVRGATVTIPRKDGTVEIRQGGSLAWRNNNPGNLEAGHMADEAGAIGGDGRFAIFPDETTGEAALEAHLNGANYSSLTINAAIAKRTPPEKGNNTTQTQKLVRDISKLPGDAVIGKLNSEEKHRLYNAVRRAEGWNPGLVTRGVP